MITGVEPSLMEEITNIRVKEPERAIFLATQREKREIFAADGRLNIIAADHAARGVMQAGEQPFAMADRHRYLSAIVEILADDAADGIMASMDVLEELLLLNDLVVRAKGKSFLDGKVMIASLNRGGLSGSSWELDDPVTGATPESIEEWNLDGAKLLLRIDYADANSLKTINYCANAVSRLAQLKLPTFLEPLPVIPSSNGPKVVKEAQALQKIVGVASALGETSSYLWLKLPYCPDFQLVAKATTLPILLLGGESGNSEQFISQMKEGLSAAPNVRGAMIGRNVLFPSEKSPAQIAHTINQMVHSAVLNTSHT